MKLISMHVDDFGGLHNYDYNFEDGLNVVLHDNGWGKTTMAAFMKAMLYGFDTKRSKDITENERKRYLPWQGGKYGGSLDFEAEGVRYRIFRTFGETPRFDKARILNLDSNTTARIDPDRIGETLFKLDASAFQRSVFINQNGLGIEGASSSIHTRLNSLVSQANDVAAYDDAIAKLTAQIKIYEKTGNRGQLGDITRQISILEHQRDQLEADISQQDSARARISEIDILLNSINKELDEKKKRLDEVSGEAKQQEANKKLLDDVNAQLADLQQRIDAIKADLGGRIPNAADIDQVKRQKQTVDSLTTELAEIAGNYKQLTEEYNALLEQYEGTMPTTAQLDEIQSIYGELQGTLSTGNEETIPSEAGPEGYTTVKAAVDEDDEYISRLRITLDGQTTVQQLIKKLETQGRDIQKETESWDDKKKRYSALSGEVESLKPEVDEKAQYKHESVGPVISKLEDLQKDQQLVDVKKEELAKKALTPEQEEQLVAFSGELPDAADGNAVLKKFRNASKQQADIQGLNARLDGEKSKADSLKASLDQMGSVPETDAAPKEAPKKSAGGAMIGGGAAVAVIGLVLIFVLGPVMSAVAAVGAVLAVLGVVNNNNYKKQVQEYEIYQATAAQRQEAQKRKADMQSQLNGVQSTIADLERQIADINTAMASDQAEVNAWFAKWGNGSSDISEEAIDAVLDNAEQTGKLRKKKQDLAEKEKFVEEKTAYIDEERAKADDTYPEINGLSFAEALSILRSAETDYKIKAEKLQTAVHNLNKFLEEAKVSEDQFKEESSPRIAELTEVKEATEKDLQQALEDANEMLAPIGLTVTAENVAQIYRKTEQMLSEYKQHADKVKGRDDRQQRKQQQVDGLKKKLEEKVVVLQDNYEDLEMPERLTRIRGEVDRATSLKRQISEAEMNQKRQQSKLDEASKAVELFLSVYGQFDSEKEDILEEIYAKAASFAELDAAKQPLEKQKASIGQGQSVEHKTAGAEEGELRERISVLEERRDNLRDEYTQKSDFIRQADQSLEKYPDAVQEIHQLYDQKQKAQNTLIMLKRTIQLITQAKENLANRYLSKVEDTFNNYMHVWLNNDAVRGILDIDFNITIEENDKAHVAEGYSTGTCDLIDFCMRLALVDTLFENEQPFLILDDPFVNLDVEHLDKALELLNVMAANKQLVYFVCHPIRAVEVDENSASREEFVKLAEATRKTIENRKSSGTERKKIVRKSPKEMYKVAANTGALAFKPAKPNYTITNNIFSMNFVMDELGVPKDNSYELFFIDAVGHVLNERQLLEVKDGKLSMERVQFCLNTRDDSGDQYELMIRESGQDDYEVVARIPFKVKLAFAGTFSFDF